MNDDLSAFGDNAGAMGRAGNRTVDELVYALVVANPATTEDTNDVFDEANHGNNPASGAAPSEAGVEAAKIAMSAQVDQNGILLGIRPRFLVCSIQNESKAIKLATAEFSPDGSANPFEPNSVRETFQPVGTARLTGAPWYMFGPRGTSVQVNFLNGMRRPSLERDSGWSTFAMHWRVWIDVDPIFVDWRAAYRNPGA